MFLEICLKISARDAQKSGSHISRLRILDLSGVHISQLRILDLLGFKGCHEFPTNRELASLMILFRSITEFLQNILGLPPLSESLMCLCIFTTFP